MHEFGLTQTIVAIAAEHAGAARVRRISLAIGQLSAVLPDSIQFCFDVCSRGTVVEGAELQLVEIPGLARCRQCGHEFFLAEPFGVCECGSTHLEIIQGEELKITELELEDLCV